MRVLVTGASGFVGQFLVKSLKLQDISVVGIGRQLTTSMADVFFSVPDFTNKNAWREPLTGCDVLVHLAARVHVMNENSADPVAEFHKVNVQGTLCLAQEAAKAGVKRFIFISSIGVNGNATPVDCPFTPYDQPNPHDFYSVSKYEAELGLQKLAEETGLEVVIIRPPLIYGYDAPGNFGRIINVLKNLFPLPLGAIHNKRSFVYVGNLVGLIIRCIDHPSAVNQVFLVSDGNDLSTTELLRGCATALGVKSRLIPIPQKIIEVFAALMGKKDVAQKLCGNLQVDISKARTILNWTPPMTVEDGLKATATGFNKVDK